MARAFLLLLFNLLLPWPEGSFSIFRVEVGRLQYAGHRQFNLAYFRHTGQWWEIAQLLSIEECLPGSRVDTASCR